MPPVGEDGLTPGERLIVESVVAVVVAATAEVVTGSGTVGLLAWVAAMGVAVLRAREAYRLGLAPMRAPGPVHQRPRYVAEAAATGGWVVVDLDDFEVAWGTTSDETLATEVARRLNIEHAAFLSDHRPRVQTIPASDRATRQESR